MAAKAMPILLFVVAILVVVGNVDSASPQSPAPAGADCTSLVLGMADCLPYISSGSTDKKPQGNCCSGIKSVLKTDAQCLCYAFKNSAQFGVTMNVTKAMALPSACHLSTPNLNNCGLNVGTVAPASAPVIALAPTAIAAAPTSISGANEVAPAAAPGGGSSSGSTMLSVSVGSLVLALIAAAFSSI